eukprot:scaffold420_cov184-Alexandrium_tamarense.AAC.7
MAEQQPTPPPSHNAPVIKIDDAIEAIVAVDGVEQKLHLHVNERVKAIECNDMMHGFCIPSCSAFNL